MAEQTLEEFNADVSKKVEKLHDRMAAAGHPITPEEAKFLWVAGMAAVAEMMDLDASPLLETGRRLAEDLPRA